MSSAAAEPAEKISHATPVKSVETVETTVEPISDAVTKTSAAAEKMVKENAATLAESGSAATTAFQELAKAYQELASKNAKNLAAAIHALSSVKSITEFIDLEQKLIKEGVAAAVSDSTQIARLTAAVFTAAIDPGQEADRDRAQVIRLNPGDRRPGRQVGNSPGVLSAITVRSHARVVTSSIMRISVS